jgi:general secretion pathway protein D
LNELRKGARNSSMVEIKSNDPLVSGQLKSQTGDANLLANPRVRVRNKQSAKILIGERVPVITTTTTANVGSSQSISYLDVGLKLEIEPTVSLDDEVAMKIALEVSNITQTITLTGGTQAYRLGTRNTSTSLQVHDGETNILAGLIQRDQSHSNTGVPGLNELPLLNRLFGMAEDNDTRTEIVLLVTPHIVRGLDVPGIGQQEFLSGTEASTGAGPIQLGQTSGARPGAATPNVQPVQAPRTAPVLPPRAPVPGSSPMPQMPQSAPPQFYPPTLNAPQPAAPATPTPPGLVAPSLVPTPPGT